MANVSGFEVLGLWYAAFLGLRLEGVGLVGLRCFGRLSI